MGLNFRIIIQPTKKNNFPIFKSISKEIDLNVF